ncbi:MAG: hypothetical protein ABGY71_11840 [bacterium]|nr:hypothetical protein [Planctomycetota bacterium]HIL51506.1 hypothetical protein [Planctomycetota bacterium]
MRLLQTFTAIVASTLLTVASAQTGADGCTTPGAIAGQGSFPFDSSLATTGLEGQLEGLCLFFGSSAIDNDVWFDWTADATGTATISTCLTAHDTKIAAYPAGGCPAAGSSMACNDDSCGLQSVMTLPVTAATVYTLQIGSFPGAGGGPGTLDILIGGGGPLANDSCTTAVAIAGQGNFPYDSTGATTGLEGQTEVSCSSFGTSAVDNDIWFDWTADATGQATISTCSAIFDTKIASYPAGGCPAAGSSLACNDDTCGLQSQISFPVTNATVYGLQIGTFPGTAGGVASMDILISAPLANDDCGAPTAVAGQGSFPFNNGTATTGVEGQTELACYSFGTSAINNDVWFNWTADATGLATVSTCSVAFDTRLAVYPSGGCPVAGSSIACNDDTCGLQSEIQFPAVAATTYLLQVGNFPGTVGGLGTFDVFIAGPSEPGTAFCFCTALNAPCANGGAAGNGCDNGASIGGANLTASGVPTVGADTLVLESSGLAPNQPGLYFQGLNAVNGGLGIVFGDGIRCAGGGIVRLGVVGASATGTSSTAGLTVPISAIGGVLVGDLRHYQLWYRSPGTSPCGASFNLTNGYSIQW